MNTITPNELRDGDVLLYHGTAFISRMILTFDGGDYSHAAVFHAGHVTEALAGGVTLNSLPQSTASARYVDVFRFTTEGHALDEAGYPVKPINDEIERFEAQKDRYGYEQILLLALLCSTRQLAAVTHWPGFAMVLRNVLDSACEVVSRLMSEGKEPVICSELVYRCYTEAQPPGKYKLIVRGADVARGLALAPATLDAVAATPEVSDVRIRAADFLLNYYAAKRPSVQRIEVAAASGETASGSAALDMLPAAVPDFVTPRDLQFSPTLQMAGRLA